MYLTLLVETAPEITMTTPAVLFPAISLLMLAYTNRFLSLASLIRELHSRYKAKPSKLILSQIANLRHRVSLIRNMQALGVMSMLLCVLCMFLLFAGYTRLGKYIFGVSMVLMMGSLVLSLREVQMSVRALNLHLSDLEQDRGSRGEGDGVSGEGEDKKG